MASKAAVDKSAFNADAILLFELRLSDFEVAMGNVYDSFADVNALLSGKGLHGLDDMLEVPAAGAEKTGAASGLKPRTIKAKPAGA